MALEISTAGILVKYAIESTAGTRPTTGFKTIPNIKSIPDLNPEPSTLEVTDLSDVEWRRYIDGLKDVGGAVAFGANYTKAFKETWTGLVAAAKEAKESGKATWFEVYVPNFASFFFAGMPSDLGLPSSEVDSVFEGDVYVAPNQIEGWGDSTDASL